MLILKKYTKKTVFSYGISPIKFSQYMEHAVRIRQLEKK